MIMMTCCIAKILEGNGGVGGRRREGIRKRFWEEVASELSLAG